MSIKNLGSNLSDVYTILGLWATLQMAAAIICCCAPVYKPIMPEQGPWKALRSWMSSTTLRTTGSRRTRPSENSGFESSGNSDLPISRNTNKNSPRQGWTQLTDSTKQLAWADTHQHEAYALSQRSQRLPEASPADQIDGIHVSHTVDIV
jgi:hypothetical protein